MGSGLTAAEIGQSGGELLAVLAFPGGGSIDDVLGGDLKAAACSPLVELGELVAGFPLVGGHTRPDGAPGGHKQTLRARQHITGRTRRSANRLA